MRRATALRAIVFAAVAALFLGSLAAIAITGPVVVRSTKLDVKGAASAARLQRDVERLTRDLAPRGASNPASLDRAAAWIAEELRAARLEVALQAYDARGTTYRNVVGFRRGLDTAAPVRVLGAHYDASGPQPGADDNASGVAVLLEIARTLQPEVPRHSQYFVAFSTAGPPFFGTRDMGSRRFAEDLLERGVAVDVMVALDLVGTYDDEHFPLYGLRWLYPSAGGFAAVVGDTSAGPWIRQVKLSWMAACDLGMYSFRAPRRVPGIGASDDRSFRELGLPGVRVTDTALLRRPQDPGNSAPTPELDYARMADLVRCFHGLLWDRDVAE